MPTCESSKKLFRTIPTDNDYKNIISQIASKNKIATRDFKKLQFEPYFKHRAERISLLVEHILKSGQNLNGIVNVLNNELKENIFLLSKKELTVDVDKLKNLVVERSLEFLKSIIKRNVFIEFNIIKFVQSCMIKTLQIIRSLFYRKAILISNEEERQIQSFKTRACSLNIIEVLIQLIRSQIGNQLVPLQNVVTTLFTNIIEYVLTFYIPTMSKNPVLASITECINDIIMNIITGVTTASDTVNVFFNFVIYGTSTGIESS